MCEAIWYFAYGSNMDQGKMETTILRVPPQAYVARLSGHRFEFSKKSKNWNWAGNIELDPESTVWGVVYLCTPDDIGNLRACEKGYYEDKVDVYLDDGTELKALTYIANETHTPGKPKAEYAKLVVGGAESRGLPRDYIGRLRQKADRA